MRICVFGAGAVGGFLAARLAKAGHDIAVVARGRHLDAIRARGLRLESADGEIVARLRASDRPEELGPQDYVILAVKAPDAPAAADRMASLLAPETAVVTAMNGIPFWYFHDLGGPWSGRRLASVDPGDRQWNAIGPQRAIGCVVYSAGETVAPGVVRHLSGERFVLGEPSGAASARLARLAAAFQTAGLDAPACADIRTAIWTKLWGNAAFNPVSVLTDATLDVLARDADSAHVIRAMMAETAAIAAQLGVRMPVTIGRRIAMAAEVGAHRTSMLQDFDRGRVLELDALLGVIIEMGKMVGLAAPTCETVYRLVRLRARQAEGR